jgi:DNA-binding NarL/FixJ family response regulator
MIRVAIAEQETIVRWALEQALANTPELEIVGRSGTAAETLDIIEKVKPDLVLVDTALPDHSGFDLLAAIRELAAGPLVIVLASPTDAPYAARALAAGAHGYVSKAATPAQLIDAMQAVLRGERVVSPGAEALLALGDNHPAGVLTARELQVMELLANGMTNREIADNLGISNKTVDTHRGHVMKKLGRRNNSDLTRVAVRHGYVTL